MNGPDPERVSNLFLRASELAPERREEFLRRTCANDSALREEVASLLDHDSARDVPDLLSVGRLASGVGADEPAIEWIGPFRLVRKIAEGGMGVVYRAEQERPIQRPVAIKLIRPGFESRQVIARFESERQALALMNHPNVARVLDAGTTEGGRPYFAMDFVDGDPITTYCDNRRLPLVERLRLFLSVCEGIQHAHRKAIIHRDIKPTNVLVTVQGGRAIPIIIDFGIAKALDSHAVAGAALTEVGQLIGTLEYMSPEQAEMTGENIDTRTDVYSLAALLYELLAGVPPFDPRSFEGESFDAARRIIREVDPPAPSQHSSTPRDLRGDLDRIVMKGLNKDRDQRYDSPQDLAEDVRRYLDHQPVLAAPPSTWYRSRKFAGRHKVGLAFAATLLALLLAFAVSMSLQAARTVRERDRANAAAQTTEKALTLTLGLLESYGPGKSSDRQAVDRIVEQADQLNQAPAAQGRLFVAAAQVYRDFGLYGEAIEALERALPLLRGSVGEMHPEALAAMDHLGFIYVRVGSRDEGELLLVAALAGQRETLGDGHPDTLNTMVHLANLYTSRRLYDASEQLHLEALNGLRSHFGPEHRRTLSSMINLGILYSSSNRYDEAEVLLVAALDAHRKAKRDDDPATLAAIDSLAVLHTYQKRYDEAETLYREALERKQRVLGDDHPRTLKTLYNFACSMALRGRDGSALELLRRAIDGGYSDLRIADDPDFESLREHDEFRELVAIVERRAGRFQ